jgi:two-component system sensor histidine kinase UhpB
VRLRAAADGILLELVDDGVGLSPDRDDKKGHHGLRWLAERVQGLGGSFELVSITPHGVRLTVRLPSPTEEVAPA